MFSSLTKGKEHVGSWRTLYQQRKTEKSVGKRKLTPMIGSKSAQQVRMGALLLGGMVSSYPMEREKKKYIHAYAK